MKAQSPFPDTLFLLRQEECITIFTDLQEISSKEEKDAAHYLETEFENERLEFLSDTVSYHKEAAVWAAKVLYHSAQLYLVRENTAKDLNRFIHAFKGKKEVSALLSADLSLRFLPQVILALKNADPEDPLIGLLENILTDFHYSAVGYDIELGHVDWEKELSDSTYRKLYLERIFERKAYALAEIPFINQLLTAEFGLHKDIFWRELKIINH